MSAWTNKEREYLIEECRRGILNIKTMAKVLRRSHMSVAKMMSAMGLKRAPQPRFWTKERSAELREMWLAGKPKREIARHFGVTVDACQKRAAIQHLGRAVEKVEGRAADHASCTQCGIRDEFAAGCPREACTHYTPPVHPPLVRYGVVGPLA